MTSEEEFFTFLETRKRKINQESKCTDLKKLKSEILSFIEESQSFQGILSELFSSDKVAEKDFDDVAITSEFIVSDCISLLKSKARQASCSLDLLAAELLSKKLLKAINSYCDGQSQFLNNKQKTATSTIVMMIKILLKDNSFNRVHFAKCLSSEQQDNVPSLPLEVLWILHSSRITSFNTYLACCSHNTVTCGSIVKGMVELLESSPSEKQSKQIVMLPVFLSVLLPMAYKEKTSSDEKRTNLEKVAESILQNIINDTTGSSLSSKESSDEDLSRIDIFEVVRHVEDIPQSAVSKFFNDQLHRLLFAPSKCSEVSFAVKNQGKWSFSSLAEQTRTRFQQFLYVFDPKSIMARLRQAFMRNEVDWKTALSFLTVFLVCQEEAAALIRDYTNMLLDDAMTNCDAHAMAVLTLVIRQSSLEGSHVFPSYLTWFKSKFGNAATTLLNNKKTVQCFMQFLSDLVPYEPSYYLKVHIIKSPQVPSKLRSFVHDYVSLAKTRLMDLKEPVELTGVYDHESSILPHSEEKTEHQKLQEQATKEVEIVLDSYGKTGKVPGSVMEASIFRKPYFIGRFLPALLLPRKLPERPDTRCKLIETLSRAGKISSGMLDVYYKACEKMAFDCDESSSEDDSGCNDLEKLKKNLNNLSQDIAQSFQSNEKTCKTGFSAKISLLASHIKSMAKSVTVPSPVMLDLVSPGLEMKTVQIVDCLLNTFCCVCVAAKCVNSNSHFRFKWLSDYVSMVMSVPAIHKSLYYRLWTLLCCKDALTLGINHIQGLASFLCYLSSHCESPVVFTNLNIELDKKIQGNNYSFVVMIFHLVPFKTLEWMEFSTRLFCAYLKHAAEAFPEIEMGSSTQTTDNINLSKTACYVPQSLIQKLWYLMHRFSFSTFSKQGCQLNEDLIETMNRVKTTALYQRLIIEAPKVSFGDWLMWETFIERDEDIFTDTDRGQYHDSTVLGLFLPMTLIDGGCGNSYRTACTKMIDMILDNKHRTKKCGEYQCPCDVNSNIQKKLSPAVDLVNLLERMIHFMVSELEDKQVTRRSWLLEQYYRRLATLAKDNDIKEISPKWVLIERETRIFTELITQLPAYLVFNDHQETTLTLPDINVVASFVNNYLRPCSQCSCRLSLDITSHLLKGLLVFTPVKDERSSVTKSLIKEFFQKCPLFVISLQHYWEMLRFTVACTSGDIYRFNVVDTLCKGISSICSESSVSMTVLMDYSPWMIASCFYLRLQTTINGVKSYHCLMKAMDVITASKVSVCLFACILSNLLELVLHGNEISDNNQVWMIVMEVLFFCPDVLVCFMEGQKYTESHSYNEDLYQLRSLVLPDKYSKLLPVVFFSLFTKCKQTIVEKVKQFSQFTKITIKMNQDFAEIRKLCLENQSYKSCEKPFQIEFAKTVFQFLRHHAL